MPMADNQHVTSDGTPAWPRSSLLGRLDPADRQRLTSLGTRAVFPERHVLIGQGARDDHIILLVQGLAKIVVYTETGHEALLAVRMGGDLVGEMASLGGKTRSANVIACVRTSARLIPADLFGAFLKRNPSVSFEAARMLSERLRWANEQRVAFADLPARKRVARILVEIAQTYGHNTADEKWDLGVHLSHAELAAFAGVGLSAAEKSLRWLQESGAIARGYREVTVTNMSLLLDLAGRDATN